MKRFIKISSKSDIFNSMNFLKDSKRDQVVLFVEKVQEKIAIYRKDAIYTSFNTRIRIHISQQIAHL